MLSLCTWSFYPEEEATAEELLIVNKITKQDKQKKNKILNYIRKERSNTIKIAK